MPVIVFLGLTLAATSMANAAKARRQGCITIFNNSGGEIVVHLKGSSSDGFWNFKSGIRALLSDSSKKIIVDEETIVWAEATDGSGSYPKLSLLADPTTEYVTGVTRNGCKGAAWIKEFI
jgi:hypothetical protein